MMIFSATKLRVSYGKSVQKIKRERENGKKLVPPDVGVLIAIRHEKLYDMWLTFIYFFTGCNANHIIS